MRLCSVKIHCSAGVLPAQLQCSPLNLNLFPQLDPLICSAVFISNLQVFLHCGDRCFLGVLFELCLFEFNTWEPFPGCRWTCFLLRQFKIKTRVMSKCMCRGPLTRCHSQPEPCVQPTQTTKDKDAWFREMNVNRRTSLCKTPPAVLAERDVTSPVPGMVIHQARSTLTFIDATPGSIAVAMHELPDCVHMHRVLPSGLTGSRLENKAYRSCSHE